MAMRRGFTLVELVVVMGIFGGLMLVGTNVFLQVIQTANTTTTETELRENMSTVLETISRSVRKASCFSIPATNRLNLYSDKNCTNLLTSFSFVGTAPNIPVVSGVTTLTSNKVYTDPLVSKFEAEGTSGVRVTLKLNVVNPGRGDFSGTQIATQSVSLRQLSY